MENIHIFNRQCNASVNRKNDVRPTWFSHQECFNSLLADNSHITVCLDGKYSNHHVDLGGAEIIEFSGGSDAASFDYMLDVIANKRLDNETIVYIVEDDYLHANGWQEIMIDGIKNTGADYVSLYDHPDKYMQMYKDLRSRILLTEHCHWRTTPSCCNTYAARMGTLRKHWNIHKKYCDQKHTHEGYDHTKFLNLWDIGATLVSSIPGYATHCEIPFVSPITDWENISRQYK